MPHGFQTFRPDGSLQIDVTTRLARHLLTVTLTPPNSGAIHIPGMDNGAPFYALTPMGEGGLQATRAPTITLSGSTASWSFPSQAQVPHQLTVMVW